MQYEWDSDKATANLAKHGVRFDAIEGFDWETALIVPDARFDYGERRWQAFGMIASRVHMVAFTVRGQTIRVISLRKANERETRRYHDR